MRREGRAGRPAAKLTPSAIAPSSARTATITATGGCPAPSPLPIGHAVSIDFVDFVFHDRVTFINGSVVAEPATASPNTNDGLTVFIVSCEFSAFTASGRIGPPAPGENNAAYLPAGTSVHSVRGSLPRCRLTARRDGRWVAYLAQHEVIRVSATQLCAIHPTAPR